MGCIAVSTYATVSIVFWYIGMVPDLATVRDRAKTKSEKAIYGIVFGMARYSTQLEPLRNGLYVARRTYNT